MFNSQKTKYFLMALFITVFAVTLSLIIMVKESPAEQKIHWIGVDKESININEPTTVTISTEVDADPNLIPASITLIRYDANGKVIENLGALYDDGKNGDSFPNDNIFTTQITFNESEVETIFLKTSAAFKRRRGRVLSFPATINVHGISDPEQVLADIVTNLKANNIPQALEHFDNSPKNERIFTEADSETYNTLIYFFENAEFIEGTDSYKIYNSVWLDDNGAQNGIEFTMAKNNKGNWIVVNW